MKRTYLFPVFAFFLFSGFGSFAQVRKNISQFSHFQGYFNPGLTGYEASTIRGFVRNQSSGLEGAPKTFFFSTEIDFGELAGETDPSLMGKNAVSVNLLHDTYGAIRENELLVGYATRIRLSKVHNVRFGAAISYQSIRLDGNSLSPEEASDPSLGQFFGTFSDMQVIDFNLGMAFTHKNYYFSYGIHRLNGGKKMSGDVFMGEFPPEHIIQAGIRESINPNLALIANLFVRSRKDLLNVAEINLKALIMNKVWIGAGHRLDHASNLQAGFLVQKLKLGYVYEFPTGERTLFPGTTHEITATFKIFDLTPVNRSNKNDVKIW